MSTLTALFDERSLSHSALLGLVGCPCVVCPMMKDAWANYVDIDAEYHRIETNPRLVQAIAIDEMVVIIVLNITIKKLSGKINICIPASILEGIFKAFDNNSTRANKRKEIPDTKSHEEIMRKISESFLDVKAYLGQTEIHMSDLYNIEIGDVILLNKDKDSTVDLYVGDTPWFSGKLGTRKQNMAVKIYEKYNHLDI